MAEKKRGRPAGSKNKSSKANKSSKKISSEVQEKSKTSKRVIDEIWAFVLIAVGIFMFAAVQFTGAGAFGKLLGNFLKGTFGLMGLVLPWYLIVCGILMFAGKTVNLSKKSALLTIVIFLMLCLFNSGRFLEDNELSLNFPRLYEEGIALESGGVFGMSIGKFLIKLVGKVGLYVISSIFIFVPALLVVNTPISRGFEAMSKKAEERRLRKEQLVRDPIFNEEEYNKSKNSKSASREPSFEVENPSTSFTYDNPYDDLPPQELGNSKPKKKNNILAMVMSDDLFKDRKKDDEVKTVHVNDEQNFNEPVEKPSLIVDAYDDGNKVNSVYNNDFSTDSTVDDSVKGSEPKLTNKEAAAASLSQEELNKVNVLANYKKPSIDLLKKPKTVARNDSGMLQAKAEKLESTLKSFNVDAKVTRVTQGPAVTRYEIQPNVGVKVNSISRLSDDIALNLEAKSIRIEAPIPGKAAVGIEIENEKINMVTLREIIDSKEFKEAESKITFAVGKDIAGKAIVANLKAMPHLLIAGSTGSGKSVCINSIITSILYKSNPDEVKLVLIDPKVVELGNYNGIPHLLIPVVTEPAKAAAALNWAVAEMNDRYKKFAEYGVRDLESYNDQRRKSGEQEEVLPQIVIIIDELADLMMAAPSQVEESICRLAQMARAAGMHLIVATQRPSVDIITGVIKANIPSRIAFAVSSQFDSRTILDMAGAEKLVGKGDMLFNPLGMGKPVRVQGTFVSDEEVNNVIEHVKGEIEGVEYSSEVMDTISSDNLSPISKDDQGDELLPDAIECVVKSGQASVSMLQRRFRIGYNRAARIVDMMEERGIVGPQDGSRPRQVLLTQEQLDELNKIDEEDI